MYGPLLRPKFDRKIAGVCAAFANSYGWDVTVVRIAALLLAIFTGFGFIAYLVCWIAIPEAPIGATPYVPSTYSPGASYPPQPPTGYTHVPPPPSEPPTA